MGAMQKVMQRLQAKSREDGATTRASSEAEPAAGPQEAQAPPPSPAPDPTADAESSAFVADPSAAPQATDNAADEQTVDWDAKSVDKALVVFHERYSSVSEQHRSLRARLLNMNPKHAHQVLAITSSLPQEGKSVTTINLGIVMAEGNEHQVVIVDADFRRASIARLLGIKARPGLAELIRGSASPAEVLRPTPFPNLKVIPAGAVDDKNYGELVSTSAAPNILAQLRKRFDYALLDTPPVNTISDVCMLAPHCDGAILVIEMRRTPEPTVQEAVRTLQTTNVKILGCILSRYHNPRGYYYDRYYSYYYKGD